MISVGLIGAGRIGVLHGRNMAMNPGVRLAGVADAVPEAASMLAGELDVPVRSVEQLVDDEHIDAIVICSSTDTHADLIEAAMLAGKAVFCEKPVDLSSDRIRSCLGTVKSAGKPLMIGFNRRFDPHFSALRAHLRNGDIGELELLTITGRDPSPPSVSYVKRSGGIFRDMMIHDFDMARFLLGEEFVEVHAVGSALIDAEIGKVGDVDTAAVMLKTASGKICQISNSRRSTYGYDQRVEVHGSRGMLQVQNVPETMISHAVTTGVHKGRYVEFFLERYAVAYERELQHFFDCMREGRSPSPTGEDGLRAQMIADAATIASQTGQPQNLPKDAVAGI